MAKKSGNRKKQKNKRIKNKQLPFNTNMPAATLHSTNLPDIEPAVGLDFNEQAVTKSEIKTSEPELKPVEKESIQAEPIQPDTAMKVAKPESKASETLEKTEVSKKHTKKSLKSSAELKPSKTYLDYSNIKLPDSYGENKVSLIVRDPEYLFAYWDTEKKGVSSGFSSLQTNRSSIKIYKSFDKNITQKNGILHKEILLSDRLSSQYIKTDSSYKYYKAFMEEYSSNALSKQIAISNTVELPNIQVANVIEKEWKTVEKLYKNLRAILKKQPEPEVAGKSLNFEQQKAPLKTMPLIGKDAIIQHKEIILKGNEHFNHRPPLPRPTPMKDVFTANQDKPFAKPSYKHLHKPISKTIKPEPFAKPFIPVNVSLFFERRKHTVIKYPKITFRDIKAVNYAQEVRNIIVEKYNISSFRI